MSFRFPSLLSKLLLPHSRRITVLTVFGLFYAWFASGLRPFSSEAYEAVFAPPALLALLSLLRPVEVGPHMRKLTWLSVVPWLMIGVSAAALEGIGLALGGRSAVVPTLSTVVDHALRWHTARFVLFCAWLSAGFAPVARRIMAAESRR